MVFGTTLALAKGTNSDKNQRRRGGVGRRALVAGTGGAQVVCVHVVVKTLQRKLLCFRLLRFFNFEKDFILNNFKEL